MKKKKVPERYKVVVWLEAPVASVEGTGRYRVVAWLMKSGANWLVVNCIVFGQEAFLLRSK
jgi:hypothetical protein